MSIFGCVFLAELFAAELDYIHTLTYPSRTSQKYKKKKKKFSTAVIPFKVYLDIFHAIQRISSKISKRHPFYHYCINSLRMVFRDPADHGLERTIDTPCPSIMEQNLLTFQDKWNKMSCDGKIILTRAASKEILSLLVHVRKGCLSGIPPGHGTNRNERLHRDLNAGLCERCYGVELAYALVTTIFSITIKKFLLVLVIGVKNQ